MNKTLAAMLVALTFLLTGCPHNDYIVELTPHGNLIERKLTFFREDGTGTNGSINYQHFDSDELKAIRSTYPAGHFTNDGDRHDVYGEFGIQMPQDIGGAGYYSNFSTSLGSASFYSERFRGNDDAASAVAARMHAADQLVDHVIGWSKFELGGEPHYQELRQFLDTDFRRDVRNLSVYGWMGQSPLIAGDQEKVNEVYARVGQYLVERGYIRPADVPALTSAATAQDEDALARLAQRLIAEKLEVRVDRALPKSLEFLANADLLENSWSNYLASTSEYRKMLWRWRREELLATYLNPKYYARHAVGKSTPAAATIQQPPRPEPFDVIKPIVQEMLPMDSFDQSDNLQVSLSLGTPPLHTNGKWDDSCHSVAWQQDILSGTNSSLLPVFAFAEWVQPDEAFQRAHFGRVLVTGDDLVEYCLWVAGLKQVQLSEWNGFLDRTRPADDLRSNLVNFVFSDENPMFGTNSTSQPQSSFPRELLPRLQQQTPGK